MSKKINVKNKITLDEESESNKDNRKVADILTISLPMQHLTLIYPIQEIITSKQRHFRNF